ncbi:MAG: MGMT family protein [Chloroflexi bacterium]|nr:MGMT family protein [Chloroflexota bacterium]MBU1747246.1 MGMT family protein [Chloroflexota bacterium]
MSHFFERVYEIVRQVPEGKVVSYGQVAAMLGAPHAARTVGWALHALPMDSDAQPGLDRVPWHRVINARGRISTSCQEHAASVQQQLLEDEGVVFDERGYTDLERFRWEGLTPWEVDELLARAGLMAQ